MAKWPELPCRLPARWRLPFHRWTTACPLPFGRTGTWSAFPTPRRPASKAHLRRSPMAATIDLELPSNLSAELSESLEQELRALDGVSAAGIDTPRAVDPVSLLAWVQLAAASLPV